MSAYHLGEHSCVLYRTREEQLTVAAAYVEEGLQQGERVFYVGDSGETLPVFNEHLRRAGVDVARALRRTALIEATHAEAHLVNGFFDAERMLGFLNTAMEDALNAGFVGLRTCGDMSWLLNNPPGASQLAEYEALLNPFFDNTRACGMCQYHLGPLPAALVDHALATHTSAVVDGRHVSNPFYRTPAIAATRAAQAEDVPWKLRELARR